MKYTLEEQIGGKWKAFIHEEIHEKIYNCFGFFKRTETVSIKRFLNQKGTPAISDSRVGYYEHHGEWKTKQDAIDAINEANRKKQTEEIEL